MGRRKKKEHCRRRSLLFEESPVESRLAPFSPVLCVDNPVTALVVPVDSDTNISWISPQFGKVSPNRGKRRRARQPCNSKYSTVSNKENTTRSRSGTRRNFPALKFVGPKEKTPPTPQSRKARKDHSQRLCKERVSRCLEDENLDTVSQQCLQGVDGCDRRDEDYDCVETVRKRRSSFRKSLAHKHRPSLARRSVFCGGEELPTFSSPDLPARKRVHKRVSQPVINLQPEDGDREDSAVSQEAKGGDRRTSHTSHILLSPLETSSMTQNHGNSTPSFTGLNPLPLRMALFGPSPSKQAAFNSSNLSTKSQEGSVCSSVDAVSSEASPERKGRDEEREAFPRLEGQGRDERHRPRRSKRLQEKYIEAVRYLHPGTPPEGYSERVLVTDTPEAEYCLTFRQRQRRKLCV